MIGKHSNRVVRGEKLGEATRLLLFPLNLLEVQPQTACQHGSYVVRAGPGTFVGIESGEHLAENLRKNPDKKTGGYDEVRSEWGDAHAWLSVKRAKIPEQEDIRKVVRFVQLRGGGRVVH
jgi:hypothetical protein